LSPTRRAKTPIYLADVAGLLEPAADGKRGREFHAEDLRRRAAANSLFGEMQIEAGSFIRVFAESSG